MVNATLRPLYPALTRDPLHREEQAYWQVLGDSNTLINLTKGKYTWTLYSIEDVPLYMIASGANEFRLLEDDTCVRFQLRKSVFFKIQTLYRRKQVTQLPNLNTTFVSTECVPKSSNQKIASRFRDTVTH